MSRVEIFDFTDPADITGSESPPGSGGEPSPEEPGSLEKQFERNLPRILAKLGFSKSGLSRLSWLTIYQRAKFVGLSSRELYLVHAFYRHTPSADV